MTTTPSLLSVAEAAERRGVNRRTIIRWVQDGKLPVALRLPGKTGAVLLTVHDVDAAPLAAGSSSEGEAQ